jgi:hypothetical protein
VTDRYLLLINSIQATNLFIVQMFLFAIFAVIAYPVLAWTPAWMRRPAQALYLASMLAAFIFVTVYSWQ